MTSLATDLNNAIRPSTTAHEHAWTVESRHRIAAGYLLYVRCPACGARRVDGQTHIYEPPVELSRSLGAEDAVEVICG